MLILEHFMALLNNCIEFCIIQFKWFVLVDKIGNGSQCNSENVDCKGTISGVISG